MKGDLRMNDYQPEIEPNLTTISLNPEVQGTPIHFLNEWITPEQFFFLRNHYSYPPITPESFTLAFDGLLENQGWSYIWDANEKGKYTIMVKATDSTGREQPIKVEWNRLGYGYNGVSIINVQIV